MNRTQLDCSIRLAPILTDGVAEGRTASGSAWPEQSCKVVQPAPSSRSDQIPPALACPLVFQQIGAHPYRKRVITLLQYLPGFCVFTALHNRASNYGMAPGEQEESRLVRSASVTQEAFPEGLNLRQAWVECKLVVQILCGIYKLNISAVPQNWKKC